MALPALFTPFALRGITLRNRIVVSPMCQFLAVDGVVNQWHLAHYGRFALGGVGACFVEATGVTPDGRITPGCTGLWNDAQAAALKPIAALFRSHGVVPAIQLCHAGFKASAARPWEGAQPLRPDGPEPAWPTVSASGDPFAAGWPAPRAMTEADIAAVVAAFAAAARRAVGAGFEMVEVHGAHGYLLHQFMTPLANHRTDSYGGSLANRMRFPLEVARAVRTAVPAHLPVAYRASVLDGGQGALTIADGVALAASLKAAGVDLVDCSSGGFGPPVTFAPRLEQGYQVPLAEALRKGAGIATMAVGMIIDAEVAEAIVADGKADLVAIAREFLADPNWPYHAALALGHPDPESLLPVGYKWYLGRRAATQGRRGAAG